MAEQLRALGTIALISCQLLLVLLVVRQFQLENRTFFHVMALGTAGFVVHALLPLQYRLAFFILLSLASIMVALGPVDGSYLVVLGLVLIGICHLPVRLTVRVGLLLGIGTLFAVWRMELLPAPWSVAIWPVLASMFMFRLALYLYTLQHDEKRPTPAQTLGYFFMLPNIVFPLYPVIDYSTFIRTYYDRDVDRIYQTGMQWIVRGLIHLILYRFVYVTWPAIRRSSRPWAIWYGSYSPRSCFTCASPASFTSASACCICSDFVCRRRITCTTSRRASPTSGAASTSTGRIS